MPVRDYPFQRYNFYDRREVAAALAPTYDFQPQRGSWGISGIVRFGHSANYVFFVSFGQTQAGHEFDEAVYANGVVRWQSQPAQKLATPMIQQLLRHNHLENDILLFLRTKTDGPYVFMGFLKYVNHDSDREQPVHFHWQILEFDPIKDYESLLGLKLEPEPTLTNVEAAERQRLDQILVPAPPPLSKNGQRGVAIPTTDFRRTPIDYEERDLKTRKLGRLGEDLVFAYERSQLVTRGRHDLAERVELVCRTIGDSAGFDIRSFDKETAEEVHLEVKTTSGPPTTPFFMSAAEVEYAKNCPKRYKIYRVYSYTPEDEKILFFEIEKPIEELELTPASFRVRCR